MVARRFRSLSSDIVLVLASGIPWFLNLIDLCYYLLVLVIHDIVDNEKVTFRPGTCFTGPNKAIDVRATKRGSHLIQTCIFIISLYALLEVYCHFIRTIVADVTYYFNYYYNSLPS